MVHWTSWCCDGCPAMSITSSWWSKGCQPCGVRYMPGCRESVSSSTMSLQSPYVLVNPQAMCVLLPTTIAGTPGSVTPYSRCGSDGLDGSGHSYAPRYQL